MRQAPGPSGEDGETEDLFRKFQSILNKLTPQKFKNLAEQALNLKIDSEQRLKGCIDKIFTKVSVCKRERERERERKMERARERGKERERGREREREGGRERERERKRNRKE